MAFKSEAQKRKFKELVKDGKMSQAMFDEFERKTTGKLPEKLKGEQKTKAPRSKAPKAWNAKVIK